MKKLTLLLIFLPMFVQGQSFVGHSRVVITKGIGCTEKAELDFGEIVVSGEGSVTLSATGQQTLSGSVQQKGVQSTGVYAINGMPNASFVVSLPTTATLYCGALSLYITEFTSNLVNNIGKLDQNGIFNMSVGGKLSIGANCQYGNFVGSYSMIINYN